MYWAPIDIDMCKSPCYTCGGTDRDRNKTLHKPQEGAKVSTKHHPRGESH